MKNKHTCNTCPKHGKCKTLCSNITKVLKNLKSTNEIYSDNTFNIYEKPLMDKLDNIFFSRGLNQFERNSVKKCMIAILTPQQKEILEMHCDGLKQHEIAKKKGIAQSAVSVDLKNIKKNLMLVYENVIHKII